MAAVATLACHSGLGSYPYADEPDPRLGEYVIGVADQIEVNVWKNPELSSESAVRPDGFITMPLLGDLRAAGLTPTDLRAEITRRLLDYVKSTDAVVTVSITEVRSYYVTVGGNVVNPGRYNSPNYLTVADAIALAGGPNRFAAPEATVVVRTNGHGNIRRIPIDYEQIIQGKHVEQNVVLLPGDIVFLP